MKLIAGAIWLLAISPTRAEKPPEGRFAEIASEAGMAASPLAPVVLPAVPAPVEAASPGVLPATTVLSEIPLDTSIVPGPESSIPGYEDGVEQCGEFVYRYFRVHGHAYPDYPTLGQPAEYVLSGNYRDQFPAFTNPSFTAPRAGDILAAKGPADGEYHTALVWKVEPDRVWVYQANVPKGTASPDWQDHVAGLPMTRKPDGSYFMPPLNTSQLGYRHDFDVAGWIHPTGSSRLPGAPD